MKNVDFVYLDFILRLYVFLILGSNNECPKIGIVCDSIILYYQKPNPFNDYASDWLLWLRLVQPCANHILCFVESAIDLWKVQQHWPYVLSTYNSLQGRYRARHYCHYVINKKYFQTNLWFYRYDLLSPLASIGCRLNKHWFAIHDNSIKTDRLLTLVSF